LTILGTNLGLVTDVTVGGTHVTPTATGPTFVRVRTPAHTAGLVDVRVTSPGGSATIVDGYRYIAVPTVTGLTPTSGPPGTAVIISGTGFTAATVVTFGGVPTSTFVVTASNHTINVLAPNHTAGTVQVTVRTAAGTSATSPVDQFTYLGTPTITTVSPTAGPTAGGTSVTITGTGFLGSLTVLFGGIVAADVTVNSPTSITVTAPTASGAGAADVVVETAGGSATAVGAYTYVDPPTVVAVTPSSGWVGGTTVTIFGIDLGLVADVTFGGTHLVPTATGPTFVRVHTPPHAAGTVDVVVTSPGGSATVVDGYEYVTVPTITGLSPTSGPPGTPVIISGTGFTGVTVVTFGGVLATSFTVTGSTQIEVFAPNHTAGTVDVRVRTAAGSSPLSSVDQFTYP